MSNIIKFTQPYSLAFQHAIHFVLDKEGGLRPDMGYVNDPKDRGGETKAGISKRAYPNEDIKNLTTRSGHLPLSPRLLASGLLRRAASRYIAGRL